MALNPNGAIDIRDIRSAVAVDQSKSADADTLHKVDGTKSSGLSEIELSGVRLKANFRASREHRVRDVDGLRLHEHATIAATGRVIGGEDREIIHSDRVGNKI